MFFNDAKAPVRLGSLCINYPDSILELLTDQERKNGIALTPRKRLGRGIDPAQLKGAVSITASTKEGQKTELLADSFQRVRP